MCPSLFSLYEVSFKYLSEVRNYGLMHSFSRFVAFVDGDDFVEYNYLSSFYYKMINSGADLVQANYFISTNGKDTKNPFSNPLFTKECNNLRASKSLLYDVFTRGYVWNKFFKREIIENNSIFFLSYKYCIEDMFFCFVYLLNSKKIVFMNKHIYHYVQRPNSAVHISVTGISQKMINSVFLCNYYAFRKDKKEYAKINLFIKKFILNFMGISKRKYLEMALLDYLKIINKQLKKLTKNRYRFDGEDWEKAIYFYIEKESSNYYINKGIDTL